MKFRILNVFYEGNLLTYIYKVVSYIVKGEASKCYEIIYSPQSGQVLIHVLFFSLSLFTPLIISSSDMALNTMLMHLHIYDSGN